MKRTVDVMANTRDPRHPSTPEQNLPVSVSKVFGSGADAHRIITVGPWKLMSPGEAGTDLLISDQVLMERVEYQSGIRDFRRRIRELHAEEGARFAPTETVDARPRFTLDGKSRGSIAVTKYLLDEAQALFLVSQITTQKAREMTHEMIQVYMLARRGLVVPKFDPSWQNFHDRMQANPPPKGYFCVFRETAEMVLRAIYGGLVVDEHTVPDISVGIVWAKHWSVMGLEQAFGSTTRHRHIYPPQYPQSGANGTIEVRAYPMKALGVFREWLEEVYIPEKFPNYIQNKERAGALPEGAAVRILRAFDAPLPARLAP